MIGRFEVYYSVECGDIDHAEALTHQALKKYRTQSNREFFAIPPDMATKIIKKCVSLIEDVDGSDIGSDLKSSLLPRTPEEPEIKTYTAYFICPRCATGFHQTLAFGEDDLCCPKLLGPPNCQGCPKKMKCSDATRGTAARRLCESARETLIPDRPSSRIILFRVPQRTEPPGIIPPSPSADEPVAAACLTKLTDVAAARGTIGVSLVN